MIELYSADTPNGQKVHIVLEELALPYRIHRVDLAAGEQATDAFLALNPNGKIPAIVDTEGPGAAPLTLFESGAILWYLAEKAGRLLPAEPADRAICHQWLMFQMGGVGPMLGQAGHFLHFAPEPVPYGIARYGQEARRLYQVAERRLAQVPWFAGEAYTVADVALFPWLRLAERLEVGLDAYPQVAAWLDRVAARPAVQRGLVPLAERSGADA